MLFSYSAGIRIEGATDPPPGADHHHGTGTEESQGSSGRSCGQEPSRDPRTHAKERCCRDNRRGFLARAFCGIWCGQSWTFSPWLGPRQDRGQFHFPLGLDGLPGLGWQHSILVEQDFVTPAQAQLQALLLAQEVQSGVTMSQHELLEPRLRDPQPQSVDMRHWCQPK